MSSQVAIVIGAGALGRATAAILAGSGLTVVVVLAAALLVVVGVWPAWLVSVINATVTRLLG